MLSPRFFSFSLLLKTLISCSVIFILVPSLFCFPSADDYSFATVSESFSFLDYLRYQYDFWSGRYTSNVFEVFCDFVIRNLWAYRSLPFLFFALFMHLHYYAFKTLRFSIPGLSFFWSALLFTVVVFSIMPNIAEALFWYIGIVVYLPGLITLGWCWLFAWKWINTAKSRWYLYPLIIFLTIITIGTNEIMLAVLLSGYLALMIRHFEEVKKRKPQVLLLIIVALLAVIVEISAPGNFVRSVHFDGQREYLSMLKQIIAHPFRFMGLWITFPPVVVLLVMLMMGKSTNINLWNIKGVLIGISIFALLCAVIVPVISTGILGQHRTINVASVIFLWMLVLFLKESNPLMFSERVANPKSINNVVALLVLTVFFSGNVFASFTDLLKGNYHQFANENESRTLLLEKSRGASCLIISPIKTKPHCTFVIDMCSDSSSHWINKSVAYYYGIGELVVDEKQK